MILRFRGDLGVVWGHDPILTPDSRSGQHQALSPAISRSVCNVSLACSLAARSGNRANSWARNRSSPPPGPGKMQQLKKPSEPPASAAPPPPADRCAKEAVPSGSAWSRPLLSGPCVALQRRSPAGSLPWVAAALISPGVETLT